MLIASETSRAENISLVYYFYNFTENVDTGIVQ